MDIDQVFAYDEFKLDAGGVLAIISASVVVIHYNLPLLIGILLAGVIENNEGTPEALLVDMGGSARWRDCRVSRSRRMWWECQTWRAISHDLITQGGIIGSQEHV
ncbi:hypothetical protein DFP73DRAFT_532283 [Morchella snyderi]|nr:hypothetical protein DFP73DRAFT_532283 [Morchella snyderi]